MGQLLGQCQRRVQPLKGLVGAAQKPKPDGCFGQGTHPRVVPPIQERLGVVSLRVVEGETLLRIGQTRGQVGGIERRAPQRMVGLQYEIWILQALG